MSDRPFLEPLEKLERGEALDASSMRAFISEARGILQRAQTYEQLWEGLATLRDQDNRLGAEHVKRLETVIEGCRLFLERLGSCFRPSGEIRGEIEKWMMALAEKRLPEEQS